MRSTIIIISVLLAIVGPIALGMPAAAASTNAAAAAHDVHFDAPSPPGPAESAQRDRITPRDPPTATTASSASPPHQAAATHQSRDTVRPASIASATPRFITHCALLC